MLEPRFTPASSGAMSVSAGGPVTRSVIVGGQPHLRPHHSSLAVDHDDEDNDRGRLVVEDGGAVDLSRKSSSSSSTSSLRRPRRHSEEDEDHYGEVPLDLKVRSGSANGVGPSTVHQTVVLRHHSEDRNANNRSTENRHRHSSTGGVSSSSSTSFAKMQLPGPAQRAELLRIAEIYTSAAAVAAQQQPPSLPPPPVPKAPTSTVTVQPLQPESRDSSQDRESLAENKQSNGDGEAGANGDPQKQYPCATCGKMFTSASNRNMHQRIHKGVRPFQCTPCGVFFRQKAHLQKHQKTQGHLQATEVYEKRKASEQVQQQQAAATAVQVQQAVAVQQQQQAAAVQQLQTRRQKQILQEIQQRQQIQQLQVQQQQQQQHQEQEENNDSDLSDEKINVDGSDDSGSETNVVDSSTSNGGIQTNRNSLSSNSAMASSSKMGGRSRHKSSPKRKQPKPSHYKPLQVQEEDDDEDEEEDNNNLRLNNGGLPAPEPSSVSEDRRIRSFIDYNDTTHGYECSECIYASHELSSLKSHVREDHLELGNVQSSVSRVVSRCHECHLAFSHDFHYRVHNRKHDEPAKFLTCDHCTGRHEDDDLDEDEDEDMEEDEVVFKTPHKLLKHLENAHFICSRCGLRSAEKASLHRHQENIHQMRQRTPSGHHLNLSSLAAAAQIHSKQQQQQQQQQNGGSGSGSDSDNQERAAKMRKVDSLAETIRLKQQQHLLQSTSTSAVNGNEVKPSNNLNIASPFSTSTPINLKHKKAAELTAIKALLGSSSPSQSLSPSPASTSVIADQLLLLHQQQQQQQQPLKSRFEELLKRSENNNVLNHLKLPPQIQLPTKPVSGLTPPQSPVRIRGELTIVPANRLVAQQNGSSSAPKEESDSEENGLDLSVNNRSRSRSGRRANSSDENEVSTTANDEDAAATYARHLRSLLPQHPTAPAAAAPPPPLPIPGFPLSNLLPPGLLPPPAQLPQLAPPPLAPHHTDPSIAEHLLKLSSHHSAMALQAAAGKPTLAPPPTIVPPPVVTSAGLSHPYSVLSAMLGATSSGSLTLPPPPLQLAAAPRTIPAPPPTLFPGMTGLFQVTPGSQQPMTLQLGGGRAASSELTQRVASLLPKEPANLLASKENISKALESKPFHCTFCRKEFSHLSSLESHIEHMHNGESKHICDNCGKNFSSKSNLTAHRKIHSGERPFECAVCHKSFRQKAHLQKHESTHSSATPFQCAVCDKSFGHVSNLNTHMATHNGVSKQFSCNLCGKSYKDSASFKRHRLSHANNQAAATSTSVEGLNGVPIVVNGSSSEATPANGQISTTPAPTESESQKDELDSVGGENEDDDDEEEIDDDEGQEAEAKVDKDQEDEIDDVEDGSESSSQTPTTSLKPNVEGQNGGGNNDTGYASFGPDDSAVLRSPAAVERKQ